MRDIRKFENGVYAAECRTSGDDGLSRAVTADYKAARRRTEQLITSSEESERIATIEETSTADIRDR